jgi:hypothetical protein
MSVVTAIDSSALLRQCFGEGDIRLVEEALLGAVAVSALAAVEVPCAIYARFHRGLLDGRQRDDCWRQLSAFSSRPPKWA